MTRRPAPQPSTAEPERKRIAKASEPHPASKAAAAAAPSETASQAVKPTIAVEPAAPQPQTAPLVAFSTRIPQDLRDHLEWLRFTTRVPVQEHVIRALTAYTTEHPRP